MSTKLTFDHLVATILSVPVRFRDDPNGGLCDEIPVFIAQNHAENFARAILAASDAETPAVTADRSGVECHGLDTPDRVRFYEHDFYVLSNFSAFNLRFGIDPYLQLTFPTAEHAYHFQKFVFPGAGGTTITARSEITNAPSAQEAFKAAERLKDFRNPNWDAVKVDIMRRILRAKAEQHEYVRRKLLATGDRMLVEDSWRDDFWGWGPNRDGQNMLGELWMQIRAELRAK